jgi:hypothetical protein
MGLVHHMKIRDPGSIFNPVKFQLLHLVNLASSHAVDFFRFFKKIILHSCSP